MSETGEHIYFNAEDFNNYFATLCRVTLSTMTTGKRHSKPLDFYICSTCKFTYYETSFIDTLAPSCSSFVRVCIHKNNLDAQFS